MKSTLSITLADTTVNFDVDWDGQCITGIDCDPAEDFFFSDKYDHLWDSREHPDMSIVAENGFRSNVTFDEVTSELYSNKKLVK